MECLLNYRRLFDYGWAAISVSFIVRGHCCKWYSIQYMLDNSKMTPFILWDLALINTQTIVSMTSLPSSFTITLLPVLKRLKMSPMTSFNHFTDRYKLLLARLVCYINISHLFYLLPHLLSDVCFDLSVCVIHCTFYKPEIFIPFSMFAKLWYSIQPNGADWEKEKLDCCPCQTAKFLFSCLHFY